MLSPDEIKDFAKDMHAVKGIQAFDEDGEIFIRLSYAAPNGEELGSASLSIQPDSQFAELKNIALVENSHISGRQATRDIISLCQAMGKEGINLEASLTVGGYFWARCGFTPDADAWSELSATISDTLDDKMGGPFFTEDAPSARLVRKAAESNNPRSIWLIADSILGKDILIGSSWKAQLDFGDDVAMERFEAYLSAARTRAPSPKQTPPAHNETLAIPQENWEELTREWIGSMFAGAPADIQVYASDRAIQASFNYGKPNTYNEDVGLEIFPYSKELKIDFLFIEPDNTDVTGKQALSDITLLAESFECERLALEAHDVGSYFWARAGFTPSASSWPEVVKETKARLHTLDKKGELDGKDAAVRLIRAALETNDPTMIGVIADTSIGKELLINQSWEGSIDLNNEMARARMDAYISAPSRVQNITSGEMAR